MMTSPSSVNLALIWLLCCFTTQAVNRPDRTFYMDNSQQQCGDRDYFVYNEVNTVQLWSPDKTTIVQRTSAEECVLRFSALPNSRVLRVTFPEIMDLPCNIGVTLTFYDGNGVQTDILKTICGNSKPQDLLATGSHLAVKLTKISVPATVDTKFKFQVAQLTDDTNPAVGQSPFYMDNLEKECDQTYTLQTDVQYMVQAWGTQERTRPAGDKCQMSFKSIYETMQLRVHFTQFISPCTTGQAVLYFYDSRDQTAEMRRYTCRSQVPAGIVTSGQYLTVLLDRRGSTEFDFSFNVSIVNEESTMATPTALPGFVTHYFSRPSHCDTRISLTAVSQNHLRAWAPGARTDSLAPQDCVMTFHAQPDHVIYVHFEELSMPCDGRPKLTFYDGGDKSKALMDIFCSSTPPEDFRTTQQYLTVQLQRRNNTALDFAVLISQETADTGGLGAGAVAAIVIVLLVILAASAVAAVLVLRRRKIKKENSSLDKGDTTGQGLLEMDVPTGENGTSDDVPMKDMTRI
ncbi:uncharacterized protein LOC106181687 [Lingula anatina]|uniref:Uncharacterized protein LOC106181687 n=1 Tax=Lingula anatina TaxID=7574 RepID=A0A1S3KG32_LINAN|nr:uncharacterized protein LOC106181687 [Lingula anatina]|eukprot:XP_013421593.1 uncharacterized protein LOC106181687 [Lingula anatina]